MREESQRAEAIVERDDDGSVRRQHLSGGSRICSRSNRESAAVDPHHRRQTLCIRNRWRPHVEGETVFAGSRRCRHSSRSAASGRRKVLWLGTLRSEPSGVTNGRPRCGWRRWAPSAIACWRSRVRESPEDNDVVSACARATDRTGCGLNNRELRRSRARQANQHRNDEARRRYRNQSASHYQTSSANCGTGWCTGFDLMVVRNLYTSFGHAAPVPLRQLAREIPSLVDTPGAAVLRDLWIGAQGSGSIDLAISRV